MDTEILICPICKKDLKQENKSLKCSSNHTFDIAKQGYVNLIPQSKSEYYTKELFENRQKVFDANFYDDLINLLVEIIREYRDKTFIKKSIKKNEDFVILDAGCGEGFYSNALKEKLDTTFENEVKVYAFDIVKEAILLGAKKYKNINFMVSDISNIPIQNNKVDILLDILTPSNYSEFNRVLKKNGLLIKVIPKSNYLIELRESFEDVLENKKLDNDNVIKLFKDHYDNVRIHTIDKTFKVDESIAKSFAIMTPMLSKVSKEDFDFKKIKEITISLNVLVAELG